MPTTYAIPNGRTVMDATLYTGTGSSGLVVNNADTGTQGFYPDLIWIKSRNAAYYNTLLDYPRGASVRLFSNLTDAESNNGCQSSFNSNGFTLNADAGGVNNSGTTYVAWQWNAGSGTTSTNTNGSITSTVDVNTTAGFSIVTYAGNGVSGATIGHGLGVAPAFIILKNRTTSARNWICYHQSLGNNYGIILNSANVADPNTYWMNTTPTSTTFKVDSFGVTNESGSNFVAYCWAPVAGFSAFGSYIGNNSTDGPFVYLGFRPKFVMIKDAIGTAYYWDIFDSSRNTYNGVSNILYPNASNAEDTGTVYIDFLSNGFKIRVNSASGNINTSGDTMIYAAFAENPFKYANAR